jgi:tellurite resistance protein TehA-like permease
MNTREISEVLAVIFFLGGLGVMIVWLLHMSKALDNVSQDFRNMNPGAVWLTMIPLFGLVWQFMVVNAVAHGLVKEFNSRGLITSEAKPGNGVGQTGCILICCSIIPIAGYGFGIIGLIFIVFHLMRIRQYISELEKTGRWETRYQERMIAMQQQYQQWSGVQEPYQYTIPPPTAIPPPTDYKPQGNSEYRPKEKPENPFG